MAFILGGFITVALFMSVGCWAQYAFWQYVNAIREREFRTSGQLQSIEDKIKFQLFAQKVFLQRSHRPELDPTLESLRRRANRRFVWVWVALFTSPILPIVLGLIFDR